MGLVALVRLTKNRAVFPPINHVVVVAPPLGVLLLLLTPTHPSFTSLSSMPAWSCPGREVKKSENAGDVARLQAPIYYLWRHLVVVVVAIYYST